jgi:hypothetical protein
MISVCVATAQNTRNLIPILFDDFNYTNHAQLKKNGWIVRTVDGWPGVPGAKWLATNVTLLKDPANPRNRILRMTSSTDGTPANTTQTLSITAIIAASTHETARNGLCFVCILGLFVANPNL